MGFGSWEGVKEEYSAAGGGVGVGLASLHVSRAGECEGGWFARARVILRGGGGRRNRGRDLALGRGMVRDERDSG